MKNQYQRQNIKLKEIISEEEYVSVCYDSQQNLPKYDKSFFGFDDSKMQGMPIIGLNITPTDHLLNQNQGDKSLNHLSSNQNQIVDYNQLNKIYIGLKMQENSKLHQSDYNDYNCYNDYNDYNDYIPFVEEAKLQDLGKQIKKPQIKIQTQKSDQFQGKQGLRQLSKKVYQIMTQVDKTTYLQVAAQLNKRLGNKKQNNQQKDYKRRVYDALNVMVATQVLKKEGKYVSLQRVKMCKNSSQPLVTQQEQIMKLAQEIRKKQYFLENRRKKLIKIQNQIKFLQESYKKQQKQILLSPPVITILFHKQNRVKQLMSHKQTGNSRNLTLKFLQKPEIFGQFDLSYLLCTLQQQKLQ